MTLTVNGKPLHEVLQQETILVEYHYEMVEFNANGSTDLMPLDDPTNPGGPLEEGSVYTEDYAQRFRSDRFMIDNHPVVEDGEEFNIFGAMSAIMPLLDWGNLMHCEMHRELRRMEQEIIALTTTPHQGD